MAFLSIVTGSLEFIDPYGMFMAAWEDPTIYKYEIDGIVIKKRRMDRVLITKDWDVFKLPPVIAPLSYGRVAVNQTMGSGKTILAVEHLARVHANGGRTGANISIAWFPCNAGKPPAEWIPNVNSLKDMENARRVTLLFDDIKRTIADWKSTEAQITGAIVNASRKQMTDIIFTTQRVVNFVPPDIREVATNYEIPYITIRDQRVDTPDGMGYPVEMEILNVSPNFVFLGFGVFNGLFADNCKLQPTPKLLSAYSTMELAGDLSTDKNLPGINENMGGQTEPYVGYNNEIAVVRELEQYSGSILHLAAKNPRTHRADIQYIEKKKVYLIDAVSINRYKKGNRFYYKLQTDKKDFQADYDAAVKDGVIRLLAFTFKNKVKFIDYKDLVGKSGRVDYGKELKQKSKSAYALFSPGIPGRPPVLA